jgi:hypothetical protein
MSKIRSIDKMPFLKERLGKARSDRVRYAGQSSTRKQKYTTNIKNTVIDAMQFITPHAAGCKVGDVLQGAANMDQSFTNPLSVSRLYNILQQIEMINTREVMSMMDIDKRQAQRYVRAIKFAMPHITLLV